MKPQPCGCRKRRYPTYQRAITAALTYTAAGSPPLRIYPCPRTGHGYHLTKQPRNIPLRATA